jgi:hypothetical protein
MLYLWWVTLVDVAYWKKMMLSIGMDEDVIAEMLAAAYTFKVKKGHYSFRYESNAGAGSRRITGTHISD